MKNKDFTIKIVKLVLSAVALMGTLTYLIGMSLGWFAFNRNVSGNGMGAQLDQDEIVITNVSCSGVGVVDRQSMNVMLVDAEPSDSSLIEIEFECLFDLPAISVKFLAPDGCESAVIEQKANGEKVYHYFGTEISITRMFIDGKAITGGDVINKPLFNENGAVWENKKPVTPIDKEIYRGNNSWQGRHVFAVELTFRNESYDQNILKDFGKTPGQVCYRKINITKA